MKEDKPETEKVSAEDKESAPRITDGKIRIPLSNRTPLPDNEEYHPIFGPIIKNPVDENANFFTAYLSTCTVPEKMAFMRKVYPVYLVMITLPLIFCCFTANWSISFFLLNNTWLAWIFGSITILTGIPLIIFPVIARTPIWNLIAFSIMSLSVAALFMLFSSIVWTEIILLLSANVIAAGFMYGSTYYYKSNNYPNYELTVCLFTLNIFYFLLVSLFFDVNLLSMMISMSFSMLYCGFLLLDTYVLLEVNSKKYSTDDYILVSVTMYLDIVMLVFFLLSKLVESSDKGGKSK